MARCAKGPRARRADLVCACDKLATAQLTGLGRAAYGGAETSKGQVMVRHGALVIAVLAGSLAACGGAKDQNAAGEIAANVQAKPAAFGQCAACHAVAAGQHGIGPSLAGVVGRKAGSLAGFSYSDAMKNSGKTWDEATLDTFLTNPMSNVPGTRMSYMGQSDPAKRKAVIDYLKTLK